MLFCIKSQEALNCSLITISLNKKLTHTHTHTNSHSEVKLYRAVSALLMFSWLPPQQCVSYPCVCLIRPWMLMEATDCPLGFGLAWPYRPQCKSMLSVSLTNLSLSLLLHLSLSPLSLSLSLYLTLSFVFFSLLELLTLLYLCIQNSEALQNILKQFCFRVVAWN